MNYDIVLNNYVFYALKSSRVTLCVIFVKLYLFCLQTIA